MWVNQSYYRIRNERVAHLSAWKPYVSWSLPTQPDQSKEQQLLDGTQTAHAGRQPARRWGRSRAAHTAADGPTRLGSQGGVLRALIVGDRGGRCQPTAGSWNSHNAPCRLNIPGVAGLRAASDKLPIKCHELYSLTDTALCGLPPTVGMLIDRYAWITIYLKQNCCQFDFQTLGYLWLLGPERSLRIEPFAALHRPSGTRCLKQ